MIGAGATALSHNAFLLFPSSVTLSGPLTSVSLSFFICKMGNHCTHLKGRLLELNEIGLVKGRAQTSVGVSSLLCPNMGCVCT